MDEIPQSLQDLRRFEIITLGAMPFVMMDTTLVYSSYRFIKNDFNQAMAPTPFATGKNFSSDEQMKLVLSSLGISACVGLSDYIIRLIKRTSKQKQMELKNRADIEITIDQDKSVSEDADAVLIQIPQEE